MASPEPRAGSSDSSVLIQAAYAFLGTEILDMAAAEMKGSTKNIPRAIKVYVRILVCYIVGVFILGLIVPWDNTDLTGTAASSALSVHSLCLRMYAALIANVFRCMASAWSAGSSDLYTWSRAMHGLPSTGQAPKLFARTNSRGTLWLSVTLSTASGSSKVFTWFSNMSAVTGMLNWAGICVTLIRFRGGIKAQGLGLDILLYKGFLQPWTIIIILFADWSVFLKGNWANASFITNYLTVPGFIIMYFGYNYVKGTKIVRAEDTDFVTFVDHDR
ncbi:amino acid permease/ SLC12A domain-containing protein [Gautieria morchelliformis]|nr:amino acid permease/ SLC12A domain-containing protein [Gautieria morchelliformis]